MRVFFYCPDRHITYEGSTADRTGVGGGITVRLRMAAALAGLGHAVKMACNCERVHTYRGVDYVPLDQATMIDADVLIVHSTAGTGVGGLFEMEVSARIRILLVDGIPQPPASEQMQADWVYPCSNFISSVIQERWNLPGAEILVSHHGIKRLKPSRFNFFQRRDPCRLIYTSHPSKGLDTAIRCNPQATQAQPAIRFALVRRRPALGRTGSAAGTRRRHLLPRLSGPGRVTRILRAFRFFVSLTKPGRAVRYLSGRGDGRRMHRSNKSRRCLSGVGGT